MKYLCSFFLSFVSAIGYCQKNDQLLFIENKGQVTDQYQHPRNNIQFSIPSSGITVFIGTGVIHYQWYQNTTTPTQAISKKELDKDSQISMYRMDVNLIGCDTRVEPVAEDVQPYHEQYPSIGQIAHSFKKITYKNIYPGIDWVLYIKNNELEHEFVLHEGADPNLIKIRYDGASTLHINNDGSLAITTPMGIVKEKCPVSFQSDQKKIATAFVLDNNTLSYHLDHYNGELIIDPTLIWGTYYGGSSLDYSTSVTVDPYSYIYMCGKTASINNVATTGSHQFIYGGGIYDAFLAKFDSSGNRIWCTYYGGSDNDDARAVTTDDDGNVFLSGFSSSDNGIATPGCHQPLLAADTGNAFLAKFDSAGNRLWGTYYGGDFYSPRNQAITCDGMGNVYLSGSTSSTFNIATPGSHKDAHVNTGIFIDNEGYLVKFDGGGVRLWGTYYGTDGSQDYINAVCTDGDGNVYIAGETSSPTNISTPGAHQFVTGGGGDAFLAKFNSNGERIWGTYYGGNNADNAYGVVCKGNILYFGGTTNSTNAIATSGTYQQFLNNNSNDAFVVKLDTSGTRQWGTYFGGPGTDFTITGNMLSCDNNDDIYICGYTFSNSGIALPGAHQKKFSGIYNCFISKINSLGMAEWSSYYGGCGTDNPYGITNDLNGNIYMTGIANSSDNISTIGSYQYLSNGQNGFLARFTDTPTPLDTVAGDTSVCDGDIVTYTTSPVFWADSYTWILPNGWTGTSTTNSITTTVTVPGGNIMVIAHKLCTTDTLPLFHVTVHPLPQPVITQNQSTLSTGTYISYQWYYNGGQISGATGQSHTAVVDGDYYVVVTDGNGCSNSSDTITLSNVSVAGINNAIQVNIYPNPNAGNFVIEGTFGLKNKNVDIQVYDMLGREVYVRSISTDDHTVHIPVMLTEETPSGLYTIKIFSGTSVFVGKIRKQ